MFERFTERARQVVVLAQDEARRHESSEIRPEHILCGLFKEGEGLAARILSDGLRLSYESAMKLIDNDGFKSNGQIPFSESGKKCLEYSLREALTLGHNYIGTEHILLGLAREGTQNTIGIRKVDQFFVEELQGVGMRDSQNWPEIVKRDVEEMLRGPQGARKVPEDLTPEENEEVDAREIVADLITGYQLWRSLKGEEELDDVDEMLVRWIAASKGTDYL